MLAERFLHLSYISSKNPVQDLECHLTPGFILYNIIYPTIGAIGSSIATPTDLVKVRMQAQGKLKDGETKRYKNTFAAFKEIFQEGGLRGMYVGVGPTVKRAAILTATQVNY